MHAGDGTVGKGMERAAASAKYPDPIRLNLGSGPQRYSGFLSVDTVPKWADVVHDLTKPLPFPDNSVSELFASHVIEHFPMWQIQDILQDWCRVLKPHTGLLWGFVPDGKAVAEQYLAAIAANDRYMKSIWVSNFVGGYNNNKYIGPGQVHHYVYDQDTLSETLYRGGFYPVIITPNQGGPVDFRLVFACGKEGHEVRPIEDIGLKVMVPWRP